MSFDHCALPAEDHRRVVAIDGPAAAGKSTVARLLADRLGALLLDTGALYRAVALRAIEGQIAPDDQASLSQIAATAEIEVRPPSQADGRLYDVWLDGEDVTWRLRDPDVGAIVSQVAEHPEVRGALLPLQRRIAGQGPVVMVGRDIGTVVAPNAGLKIYLDASPLERARRRFREASTRGSQETFADVVRETEQRDAIDSTREAAPLRVAMGAILIETDHRSVEEVVSQIESLALGHAVTADEGSRRR